MLKLLFLAVGLVLGAGFTTSLAHAQTVREMGTPLNEEVAYQVVQSFIVNHGVLREALNRSARACQRTSGDLEASWHDCCQQYTAYDQAFVAALGRTSGPAYSHRALFLTALAQSHIRMANLQRVRAIAYVLSNGQIDFEVESSAETETPEVLAAQSRAENLLRQHQPEILGGGFYVGALEALRRTYTSYCMRMRQSDGRLVNAQEMRSSLGMIQATMSAADDILRNIERLL